MSIGSERKVSSIRFELYDLPDPKRHLKCVYHLLLTKPAGKWIDSVTFAIRQQNFALNVFYFSEIAAIGRFSEVGKVDSHTVIELHHNLRCDCVCMNHIPESSAWSILNDKTSTAIISSLL